MTYFPSGTIFLEWWLANDGQNRNLSFSIPQCSFPISLLRCFFLERRLLVFNSELVEVREIIIGIVVALSGQDIAGTYHWTCLYQTCGGKKSRCMRKACSKWDFRTYLFRKSVDSCWSWDCWKFTPIRFVLNPVLLFAYLAIIHAEENFLGKKFGQGSSHETSQPHHSNFSGIGNTIKGKEFNWKTITCQI